MKCLICHLNPIYFGKQSAIRSVNRTNVLLKIIIPYLFYGFS